VSVGQAIGFGRLEVAGPAAEGRVDVGQYRCHRCSGEITAARLGGGGRGDGPGPPARQVVTPLASDALSQQQLPRHEAFDLLARGPPIVRFGNPQGSRGEIQRRDAESPAS
jgi:hypothetical protein